MCGVGGCTGAHTTQTNTNEHTQTNSLPATPTQQMLTWYTGGPARTAIEPSFGQYSQKNWPSKCYPITYHDIAEDVPQRHQKMMKKFYATVFCTCVYVCGGVGVTILPRAHHCVAWNQPDAAYAAVTWLCLFFNWFVIMMVVFGGDARNAGKAAAAVRAGGVVRCEIFEMT